MFLPFLHICHTLLIQQQLFLRINILVKLTQMPKKKNSVTPYRIFLISKKKILASYDLDSAGALYLHNLLPCTFLQMSGYMLA